MGSHFPPLAGFLAGTWRPWFELILTSPVLFWAGREFYSGAWIAAKHRAADMNTLVAIGILLAFPHILVATVAPQLLMTPHLGRTHGAVHVAVYYEVAAIIVTLILMGRLLEARARAHTGGAIRALMALQAKTARAERNGIEQDIAHQKRFDGRYYSGASRRKSSR